MSRSPPSRASALSALLALAMPGAAAAADPLDDSAVTAAPEAPANDDAAHPEAPSEGGASAAVFDPSGIERPAREPGDAARDAGSLALSLPRGLVNMVFLGVTSAASLIEDEHIVPRVKELFTTRHGEVFAFPTAFAETGKPFNIGARVIAEAQDFGATTRIGFGGVHDLVAEARLAVRHLEEPLPLTFVVEGLAESVSEIDYVGVGLVPELDARNRYRAGTAEREAVYMQRRTRAIAGLGLRPSELLELLVSTSLYRRIVEDTPGARSHALSEVFVDPPLASPDTWISYTEAALRLDSREARGRPTPGVLFEAYAGRAAEVLGDEIAFLRLGGRLAGFIPLYRATNILSPRLVLDAQQPLEGTSVPFTELTHQPDYRGFDTRRDHLSLVGSIDYAWVLTDFLGARLFLDAALVAPSVREVTFDQIKHLRYAAGGAFDIYGSSSVIGSLALSTGPEGVRLLLTFGVPSSHGDRQHWD